MAATVCQQVCSEIKQSTTQASIQLDESTNSTLESHLIAFARYKKDKKMKEEFFFSNTLSAATTAADVKALVNSFFEANELSWQNFKHIYIDGAQAMIGVKLRFVTLLNNEWPHVMSSHCSLHRYTPALKTPPLHLTEVMDVAVKVTNFIRSRAKNHWLFQLLANKIRVQHVGLLFYTKVCLLWKDKCLFRLLAMHAPIKVGSTTSFPLLERRLKTNTID